MVTNQNMEKNAVNEIYDYASDLILNKNKSESEVEKILTDKGLDTEFVKIILKNLYNSIRIENKEKSKKLIFYGIILCVAALIAALAKIGYIFWISIVLAGYQIFKGYKMNS
jgi:hypothetical protein